MQKLSNILPYFKNELKNISNEREITNFAYLNIKLYLFDDPNLSLYSINYNVNGIAMEHSVPRSTGISRVFIVMYIFSLVLLFNYKFWRIK